MNNEKISVVIPTYNREKVIKKSVESVLNQTYKNIEVIIVDDGSKDNTKDIVKSIKDERIKFFSYRKNRGACYARNYGISKASGEFIAFQDSDDYFHNDKLEKQYKNLLKNKADLDFCKIKIYDGEVTATIPNDNQINEIKNDQILNLLCKGNVISTQSIFARKEIFKDIIFDESLPRFQDYDLVLRVAKKYTISFTNEVLVDLYRQTDSISGSNDKLQRACFIMLRKEYQLSAEQEKELQNYLFNQAARKKIEEYDSLCRNYKKIANDKEEDNILLNNRIKKLQDDNKKLEKNLSEYAEEMKKKNNEYNELNDNYNILNKKYFDITNSKRWKYINKLLRIIRK